MEDENLHLLIHEEIYLIPDQNQQDNTLAEIVEEPESLSEMVGDKDLIEDNSKPLTESPSLGTSENQEISQSKEEEPTAESPKILDQPVTSDKELPFAVFHSSSNNADIELLNKIITACKVPSNQYQIFDGGFDQKVKFKKALVFVPEAKAFYTPIPYKNSEFLCSKPLDQISGDVQEKTKLWNALQKFVDSLQA